MNDPVLSAAKRIHDLGGAVLWLHPKSKRPIESKWTSGERHAWPELKKTYHENVNVGIRTGSASKVGNGYLACIDVDIKNPEKKSEALAKLRELTKGVDFPEVRSGSGNGSRHLYCVTDRPFKMITVAKSKDWEICIYSEGRQMVLPPSIHPTTGKRYVWKKPVSPSEGLPKLDVTAWTVQDGATDKDVNAKGPDREAIKASERSGEAALQFKPEIVDLDWLPISEKIREGIKSGRGVSDRSGFLLPASNALLSAGLTQNEILSVLTDRSTFLGACAYDHAQTTDRERAAAWVYKYTLKRVSLERSAEVAFKGAVYTEPKKLTPEEIEKQNEELKAERHWTQNIQRGGQHGDGPPKGTIENVVLILTQAVAEDIFVRNEFAFRDSYGCNTPWGGKIDEAVTDDDTAKIRLWLGETWGFEPKKETILDAITNIACRNSFDPVKDYLEALPAWDQVPRLDTWLKKNFQAKGDPEYLAQVFRKWMVAMVLRAYEPGAKFDWMPIFEGAQGIGKSSFGRLLCGDKYFLDWLPNLGDKDAALALQGMWVVEMGELSQFRKNEMEVIKGFITRTVDKLRPPFGRRWIESARRCVFFGTTNRDKYLRDDTGNRRLKPVLVGELDFETLRAERTQLFAEAKWLYDFKKETERTLNLSGDAKIFEAKIHSQKMVEDDSNVMLDQIQDFLKRVKKQPENFEEFDLEKLKILDLFGVKGPLIKWAANGRNSGFAAKALKMLGAESKHTKRGNVWNLSKVKGFERDALHQDFF